MRRDGYNLFVLGPPGQGKRTIVKRYLQQVSSKESNGVAPSDWCYVHNFVDPDKPRALKLAAGMGRELQKDVKELTTELQVAIPQALEDDTNKQAVEASIKSVFGDNERQVENLFEEARESGLTVGRTQSGAFVITGPDKHEDGKPITPKEEEFAAKAAKDLQPRIEKLLNEVPKLRKEAVAKVKDINKDCAKKVIEEQMAPLRAKYAEFEGAIAHLDAIEEDLVQNYERIRPADEENESPLAMLQQPKRLSFGKYLVNLFVDNSELEGRPVIYEEHPYYHNLIGRIDHASMMGSLVTDFSLIKSGALHKANGGYLVLNARDVLLQPFAWEALKRAMRLHEAQIESLGAELSLISTVTIQPEPIELNVKVVLLGDRLLYYLLQRYDPEFDELFKVSADFSDDIDRSEESCNLYAQMLATVAKAEEIRPLDREAVAGVIEQAARRVGDQEKLSTHMETVTDLLRESDYWAESDGADIIGKDHVKKALEQQIYRSDRIRELVYESIKRGTLIIDLEGERIGQVNGLSVLDLGKLAFGRPSKITATTRLGRGKVVDIEREVDLGGSIHSKGVMILSSLLAHRYARDFPLSVSASLTFEQSYGMVDGDSASMAELCAILSSLASVPIKQYLAITGSVNQHGEAQPIGGATEKIEGFFDIANASAGGLTGEQGVLIPESNAPHLMLRPDIIEAVESGLFNVYTYKNLDEAVSLLTGVAAGERNDDGEYPEGTINYKVDKRLLEMASLLKGFDGDEDGDEGQKKD
jgi:lon-related putative ATP-dependent protease